MIQFSEIRAVLLDMDGVVYVGDRPLPGVQDFLDYMEATDRGWLCVTNNSSKTPDQFVEKLTRMNIRAQEENVLGSSQATAHWMAQQYPERGKVVIVGQEGLRVALEGAGFELTDQALEADFVVAGIDFGLTYEAVACRSILPQRAGPSPGCWKHPRVDQCSHRWHSAPGHR